LLQLLMPDQLVVGAQTKKAAKAAFEYYARVFPGKVVGRE
jgi:hypothetical protein